MGTKSEWQAIFKTFLLLLFVLFALFPSWKCLYAISSICQSLANCETNRYWSDLYKWGEEKTCRKTNWHSRM